MREQRVNSRSIASLKPQRGRDASRGSPMYAAKSSAPSRTDASFDADWRIFAPTLDNSGSAYAQLSQIVAVNGNAQENLRAIAHAAAKAGNNLDAMRTRAAALVLHDLLAMGWDVRNARHYIEVRPPVGGDAESKESIRRQLEFGRDDQLREPATRRFIMSSRAP